MAGDVELLFGVDPKSELEIKNQIQSIMNGINQTPFKVKVELEVEEADKMVKQLRNDIKSAIESLDAVKKASVSGGGLNISTQTAGIKEAAQVMNQLISVELELQRMKSLSGDQVNTYTAGLTQAKDAFSVLLTEIEAGDVAITDFRERFNQLKNDMASGKMDFTQSSTTNEFKKLTEGTTEYYQALNQVETMLNSVHGLQDKIKLGKGIADGQTISSISTLEANLEKLSKDLAGMPTSEAKSKIAVLRAELTNLSGGVRQAGTIFSDFFNSLKGGIAQYAAMTFSSMRIIQATVSEIREMVDTAIELNDVFTQLQIVTNATDAEMSSFSDTIAQSAQKMGASITDMVDMATVYSRLGYTLDESSLLAQYTAMLQNVGDIDPSDASDAITAIVKAYGMGVDEIEGIMDKMVAVGKIYCPAA